MTASQFAPKRDLILECITNHYKKGQRGNHRLQLKVDQFEHVTLVECEFKGKMFRDWFLDGAPVFTYWLTFDQRVDIVRRFYLAGYSGTRIADMLMFAQATIYRDIKHLRNSGELPEGRMPKVKPPITKHTFKVSQLELVFDREALHQQTLGRVKRAMAAAR